jgi:hypothetical protein
MAEPAPRSAPQAIPPGAGSREDPKGQERALRPAAPFLSCPFAPSCLPPRPCHARSPRRAGRSTPSGLALEPRPPRCQARAWHAAGAELPGRRALASAACGETGIGSKPRRRLGTSSRPWSRGAPHRRLRRPADGDRGTPGVTSMRLWGHQLYVTAANGDDPQRIDMGKLVPGEFRGGVDRPLLLLGVRHARLRQGQGQAAPDGSAGRALGFVTARSPKNSHRLALRNLFLSLRAFPPTLTRDEPGEGQDDRPHPASLPNPGRRRCQAPAWHVAGAERPPASGTLKGIQPL